MKKRTVPHWLKTVIRVVPFLYILTTLIMLVLLGKCILTSNPIENERQCGIYYTVACEPKTDIERGEKTN